MLQFSNQETAAQFEALVEDDRTVTKQLIYSGLLSNIPPAMATAMVTQQSNLIKQKAAPAAEVTTANSGKAGKADAGKS